MSDRLSASYLLVAGAIALGYWWYHLGTAGRVALLQKGGQGASGSQNTGAAAGAGTNGAPTAGSPENRPTGAQGGSYA